MRSIRSASAAAAVLIVATPLAALAATGPQIDVTPSTALPGKAVTLAVTCAEYAPSIDGVSGVARFRVGVAARAVVPAGAPVTGDGETPTAKGGPLRVASFGLLGLGGVAAYIAFRRRRAI